MGGDTGGRRCCSASAPAKVIVVGEHWVVSGSTALAGAIDLRARVACKAGDSRLRGVVVSSPLGVAELDSEGSCNGSARLCGLGRALRAIVEETGAFVPASCVVKSDVPIGAGLGSSAAVSVAFAAAYLALVSGRVDLETVNHAAYNAEVFNHGRPSGIDNTVSTYGGLVLYSRREGVRRVTGLGPLEILVVDTGVKRSTRRAVELFQRNLERLGRSVAEKLIETVDTIVYEALEAIRSGDIVRLGMLLTLSHGMLAGMGVSHPSLEEVVRLALGHGASGAKLTGAGMGGSAIVVGEPGSLRVLGQVFRSRGLAAYLTKLGGPGVEASCGCEDRITG